MPIISGIDDQATDRLVRTDARGHLLLGAPNDEVRLDYGTRTDAQPVYIGRAPGGAATADAIWQVMRFSYDAQDRVVRIQSQYPIAWDNRTGGW